MTLEEQAKLKRDTEERKDRIARQLREDLHAVLGAGPGQRIWVWIRNELCALEDAPIDQFPGRRAVAAGLDAAVLPYPELAAGLIETRADIDRAQAFYHAGLSRLRAEANSRKDKGQ